MSWLIEREYENYAWGYDHKGTIITDNGDIYTYSSQDPSELKTIVDKLHNMVKSSSQLSLEEMENLDKLIHRTQLSQLKYHSPQQVIYDAGSEKLYLYLDDNRYLLDASGDYKQRAYGADDLVIEIKRLLKR